MKLRIENWIESNKFSTDTKTLFSDSIICYKSDANRASLLFSYLAFLTIIKERIINGTMPSLYKQNDWQKLIQNLQNDDLWEVSAFEATQQRDKIDNNKKRIQDPIFNIDENIRLQIKYWKDRRNDCAHYKDNIIESSHVESFWLFIESNLSKITIEGGMQTLLNKIKNHFNPTITPPDKDISPLVNEIEFSVKKSEMNIFWSKLLDSNSEFNSYLEDKIQQFISKSLKIHKKDVTESLISLIKENKSFLKNFLSNHPNNLILLNLTDEEIRYFWKTQLNNIYPPLRLYTTFLKYALIPKNEIKEANKVILKELRYYTDNKEEHTILRANDFYESFKEFLDSTVNITGHKSYLSINERADLIAQVIEHYPADEFLIRKLVDHYKQDNSSDWLIGRLNNVFTPENNITLEYSNILKINKIEVPNKLKKFFPSTE